MQRFIIGLSRLLRKVNKMSGGISPAEEICQDNICQIEERKRKSEAVDQPSESVGKKAKSETELTNPAQAGANRKKKVAILIAYNGKGYYGLQRNKPFQTIEEEILKALLNVRAIPEDHYAIQQKMSFQRAARTDKGVSAASNVISLKMNLGIENLVQKINEELPDQIRLFGYRRTTKSFDSKIWCSGRTYLYILPTYALAPVDVTVTDEYRVTDDILDKVNETLSLYVGTHNFHNYTSGIKPNEQRARRYILSFQSGKPFVKEGIEFVTCSVRGQSFMLHHIRKMIGMMIAVVKGYCGVDAIQKSWGADKVDVPKAPGSGLLLDELYYDQYNKKWGTDGVHVPVEWSEYQEERMKFKDEYILPEIFKTEKDERGMLQWLATLHLHTFDVCTGDDKTFDGRKRVLDVPKTSNENAAEGEPSSITNIDSNKDSHMNEKSLSNDPIEKVADNSVAIEKEENVADNSVAMENEGNVTYDTVTESNTVKSSGT